MGANGSSEADAYSFGGSQGKPGIPEGIPKVTDITHNSVTLSWLSPMNSGKILAYQVEVCDPREKKWRIITSTCQGTCYHVRKLTPETRYIFRVRAENIWGQSKPSHVSEEIRTRAEPTNYLEERPNTRLVRRHSHYLKLDGGINSLLSKTEDTVDSGNSVGSIPFRRNSIRGSLPPNLRIRKTSVTSMLPGAKRENMCNMKESKRSYEESSITEEEGLNLKRISTSSTEASSIFSSNSMTSIAEDEELRILYGQRDCQMYSDNDDAYSTTNSHSTTSSQCSTSSQSSQNSTSQSSHTSNSCDHSNSNYLTPCISDNNKLEYVSNREKDQSRSQIQTGKSRNKSPSIYAGKTIFDICDNEIWKGRIENPDNGNSLTSSNLSNKNTVQDLRSLRQLLNSQDVMVKTLDSCKLDNVRRTHCAITELDEDCVTMDIVSTI